jgi:hydroxymethylpyrimidine/phosphomethylpyrimidine kinase
VGTKKYHKVLTIAGSDSSGGAGLQADMKTFSALGCYGMSVVTALTAQNTMGVTSVHAVPAAFVRDQLEAVFNDMGADAVKIGMLYSVDVVETVAGQLKKHAAKNVVLDPVMSAQSGDRLVQDKAIAAVKDLLMPLATVVTPNVPEASVFLNRPIHTSEDMRKAAIQLASCGAGSILLKGGHLDGSDSTDVFYIRREDRFIVLEAKRVSTRNNHGTGCTISSAIASYLARGLSLEKAVRKAKEYLTKAIRAGSEYETGSGHGPVHHFHEFW